MLKLLNCHHLHSLKMNCWVCIHTMSHVDSMMTYGELCTHIHLCNTHTLVQGHGFLSYGPSNSVADLLHGDISDTYTLSCCVSPCDI